MFQFDQQQNTEMEITNQLNENILSKKFSSMFQTKKQKQIKHTKKH